MLPIVVVGHVDHGKSTLLGRLLYETNNLPDGKVEAIEAMRERRGTQFEWSFVLDAFKAERDQGITIDTTQIELRTKSRDYLLIDAPGHEEFLKNMITGAANATAALLLIDVAEGVREQTQRHTYLLKLLGVKEVVVVVNKMDLVEYKQGPFSAVEQEINAYLTELNIKCQGVIPAAARSGDNLTKASSKIAWYSGSDVLSSMSSFKSTEMLVEEPLRVPVQDIYHFDHRRIIVGKIESGRLKVGDEVYFSPTGKAALITGLEGWNSDLKVSAAAGESVALTLDRELFIERGHVVHKHGHGPSIGHDITVRVIWFAKTPLSVGAKLQVKFQTATHQVTVSEIKAVIDVDSLSLGHAQVIQQNMVAEIVLHSRTPFTVDPIDKLERTSRGVLFDSYHVVGGCVVLNEVAEKNERHIYPTGHRIETEQRAEANGHNSGILWFTGLSGSGKSTLAMALEYELFQRGWQSYVLDGDNVRDRLNSDLGFSPKDRGENIRRVAEVARLVADSGNIVISAFISPYRADRERARQIASGGFHEIFIKADLETCETRDPKGLYEKARRGEIEEFTGIDAPYESPDNPDLVIDTSVLSVEECIQLLAKYVDKEFSRGSTWHRDVA